MGMIVTLYLISTNVYNSVEAPTGKGFSYIELWMIGTQIPILLSLVEYGFVLHWKKSVAKANDGIQPLNQNKSRPDLDERIKMIDYMTLIISFLYFVSFTVFYWMAPQIGKVLIG